METIELELTKLEQDTLKQLAKTLHTTPRKAIIKLVNDVGAAMESNPSLTPRQAVRLVVSRYVKA